MSKIVLVILSACYLVSFAPAPAPRPAVYWTRVTIVQSRREQQCTWDIAPARLRQTIEDPIGYPYGEVEAFSCAGDTAAVIAELTQRAAEMHAAARAYRQAHPIQGVTK